MLRGGATPPPQLCTWRASARLFPCDGGASVPSEATASSSGSGARRMTLPNPQINYTMARYSQPYVAFACTPRPHVPHPRTSWVVTCVTLAGVEGPSAASALLSYRRHSSLSLRAVRRRSRADRIGNPPRPTELNASTWCALSPKWRRSPHPSPSSTLNCSPPPRSHVPPWELHVEGADALVGGHVAY